MAVVTGLAVLTAACMVQLCSCSGAAASKWQQLNSSCIGDSVSPVLRLPAHSERLCCAAAAQSAGGHSVAEFTASTGQCSVYNYQSVCHLIHAAAAAPEQPSNCAVFAALPVSVNKLSMLQAMKKLRAAWLFDAEFGAEGDNLVCGESKLWQPEAVEFSEEGAVFDGVSSKMELRDADFGDFSRGFTWLLRLRRQPRQQAFLRHLVCDESTTTTAITFYEQPNILRVFAMAPGSSEFLNTSAPVPSNASQFVNVGFAAAPAAGIYSAFTQGDVKFVQLSDANVLQLYNTSRSFCLRLGQHLNYRLRGTVRAVGIANDTMTQEEIDVFFGAI